MNNRSLSEETIRVLISGLDSQIKQAEAKVTELQRAKKELQEQLGEASSESKPPVRRLPSGLPKRLVQEVLQKHRRLSIGEIMHKVMADRGYRIRDGSTRRALKQMMKDGLVKREEDGTYRWIEGKLI